MKNHCISIVLECLLVVLVACTKDTISPTSFPSLPPMPPTLAETIILETLPPKPAFIKGVQVIPISAKTQSGSIVQEPVIQVVPQELISGASEGVIIGESIGPEAYVCVSLEIENLLKPEEHNMNSDDYLARSTLQVWQVEDGKYILPESYLGEIDVGASVLDDRNNQLGEGWFCWRYKLLPNLYVALFSYRQSMGQVISYTWYFQTFGR